MNVNKRDNVELKEGKAREMELWVVLCEESSALLQRKDNKTVMGHNRHYNQKGDNKEFGVWIGDKSENGEQ